MNSFKFRAECDADINRFRQNIGHDVLSKIIITIQPQLMQFEVEIETTASLSSIKDAIKSIDDGHVMLQTLTTKELYTGIRV